MKLDTALPVAQKPRMRFWQIWNMSFGFLGIQFGFALQQANVPRIFQTLGAEVDKIGYLMIAAPLAGLLVQPIIGYMSDSTWSRWGRRRPYFVLGAVSTALALLGLPNSGVLWMAAGFLLLLDAAINISMEPFRAFVGDLLPKEQIPTGYAFQTFFIGAGAAIASALPWLLTNVLEVSNTAAPGQTPDSVIYSFYIGAVVVFAAVMWTVVRTPEFSKAEFDQYHPKTEDEPVPASRLGDFFNNYRKMPKVMVQLSFVQFFTWFTWFSMWTYATAAITQHIYHTTDITSAAFNEGANWWGVCNGTYNAASIGFAFLLPLIARKTSRKMAHAIALLVGGLSFISIYFVTTPAMLLLPFIGIGMAWASTLSMPYAMLACEVPPQKMGMFMGMFNMSIVIPQLVSGLTLGYFLNRFFGGSAIMMLMLSGGSMIIAAAISLLVQEGKD